jgi:tRNA-specific 2-thiouridylase
MFTKGFPGPIGLIQKNANEEIKQLAADIMVSYTRENEGEIIIKDKIYKGIKKDKKEFIKYIL